MAVQIILCKACGASISYSIENANWKCEYCESIFEKDEIQSQSSNDNEVEKIEDYSESNNIYDQYNCNQCGGQLIADTNTAADFCVYCKSPTIIKSRFSGNFRPRYCIPFSITDKQAEGIYFDHIKKHFFAPSSMKTAKTVHEIRRLYVPYWLFDCVVKGDLEWEATKSKSYTSGEYRVTETKYYRVERAGIARYERIPVDASKKLDNELMEGIEPFDYDQLTDFSVEYMAGFLVERFDINEKESAKILEKRAGNYFRSKLTETLSEYESFKIKSKKVNVNDIKAAYALLPVHLLTNIYDQKTYLFIVNGQTGKISGKVPTDRKKKIKYFALWLSCSWIISVLVRGFINAN